MDFLYIILIVAGVYYSLCKLFHKFTTTFCKSKRRLDGKVAIVTGSSRGMGFETAKELAKRGAKVILACIDIEEAESAAKIITDSTNNKKVVVMHLDLSLMSSVRKFCTEFKTKESRLDILVNNAGIIIQDTIINGEGLEAHFAVNHLGHFLLTNILLETLKKTPGSRIVVVSSTGHNFAFSLDLESLNGEKGSETAVQYYAKTKLLNILFMREFDRRLKEKNLDVTINALHPGAVGTTIGNNLQSQFLFFLIWNILKPVIKTPWEGAQTHIHLAVSEEVEGKSGDYYYECKVSKTSNLGKDMSLAKKAWEKSEKYCGIQKSEYYF